MQSSAEPRRQQLTAAEWERLRAGQRVEHARAYCEHPHYLGGAAYQLVAASPDEILSALFDPAQLERMLPQTMRVTALGNEHPAPGLELEQGNGVIKATYSVVLEHDREAGEIRFRLDRSRPSDIEDVSGFFRVTPYEDGRSLITVAATLDVGSGLVRLLFRDIIQELILMTPTQMKNVIEPSVESMGRDRVAQLR